jgi:hypothetical protein
MMSSFIIRKKRKILEDTTKNTQKITKVPGKFPGIVWSMNNPNKVFWNS